MKTAGLAWLALIIFEVVQTIRHQPTLSQFVWWLGGEKPYLIIALVAWLCWHLLSPIFKTPQP